MSKRSLFPNRVTYDDVHVYTCTVNCEIFVVKIFSDSMGNAKIKRTKIMCIIDANVVRGHLSENIFDTKCSRFTVYDKSIDRGFGHSVLTKSVCWFVGNGSR